MVGGPSRQLAEELNVTLPELQALPPFAIVEDLEAGVLDIVCEVELEASFAELERAFEARSSREYSAVRCVPENELTDAASGSDGLAPISVEILRLRGLLA